MVLNDKSSNEVLIKVEHAGRVYKDHDEDVIALRSATCEIKKGDRIALVGPSGSGKSTLLQLMAALDKPSYGEVHWPFLAGTDTLRPKYVGMIFQMPSLLPPLTVIENVELPLLLIGEDRQIAREQAYRMLESIELLSIKDKLPEELSGGQAQRAAVARVLASRPKIILADEPTGQLDHPTAHQLFATVLALLADTDAALVVATHDEEIACHLDQVWRISDAGLEVSAR